MSGEGRPAVQLPDASGLRLAIAATTWHADIVDVLLERAVATAVKAGVESPTVVRVPGTVELPVVCQELAARHDAEDKGTEACVAALQTALVLRDLRTGR
jgi:6,7-dimethyl-8-ribityllumazine synthase